MKTIKKCLKYVHMNGLRGFVLVFFLSILIILTYSIGPLLLNLSYYQFGKNHLKSHFSNAATGGDL